MNQPHFKAAGHRFPVISVTDVEVPQLMTHCSLSLCIAVIVNALPSISVIHSGPAFLRNSALL